MCALPRFYRQFKDIQTFMDELNKLLTDKEFG